MQWYDFLLFGAALIAATGYGYLEGFHAGFTKGVRAEKEARNE